LGPILHSSEFSLHLPDAAATDAFGERLARALAPGLVITLEGELGAGKTSLVRAMLRALGHRGPVKSPTYALVELYNFSSLCFYHFDFYRFSEPEEFIDAGLADYFRDDAVCCVEWPDKAAGLLPAPDLAVRFTVEPATHGGGRTIAVEACSTRGEACLARLNPAPPPPKGAAA
jgi:tRNA threonylcarbamoyladenosine biosynthesis protein TsaE